MSVASSTWWMIATDSITSTTSTHSRTSSPTGQMWLDLIRSYDWWIIWSIGRDAGWGIGDAEASSEECLHPPCRLMAQSSPPRPASPIPHPANAIRLLAARFRRLATQRSRRRNERIVELREASRAAQRKDRLRHNADRRAVHERHQGDRR